MELTRRSFLIGAGLGAAALAFNEALIHEPGDILFGGSAGNAGEDPSQVIVSLPGSCEPLHGFDPLKGWGWAEEKHDPLIQSTLLELCADGSLEPGLACDYHCSPDGMSWIFKLRQDALFSDGAQLVSADVEFTLSKILKTEKGAEFLSPIKGAVALGDYDIRIDLRQPNSNVLYALAVVGIVPASTYSDDYGSCPVGSGKYELTKWLGGQIVILSVNPHHYSEAPSIKTIAVAFQDKSESLKHARSNDLDVAYLGFSAPSQKPSGSLLPSSKEVEKSVPEGYDALYMNSSYTIGLSLPVALPYEGEPGPWVEDREEACLNGNHITSDKAVRRAINWGVDRMRLAAEVIDSCMVPCFELGEGELWSSGAAHSPCDIDMAQSILDEAGWIKDSAGIRVKDGRKAAFVLYHQTGDSVLGAIAREFDEQMKGLGICVSVKSAKLEELGVLAGSNPVLWSVDAYSPEVLVDAYHSLGMMNYPGFKNDGIDEILEKALGSDSLDVALALYRSIQPAVCPDSNSETAGDPPWVWLLKKKEVCCSNSKLSIPLLAVRDGCGWSLLESAHEWRWTP